MGVASNAPPKCSPSHIHSSAIGAEDFRKSSAPFSLILNPRRRSAQLLQLATKRPRLADQNTRSILRFGARCYQGSTYALRALTLMNTANHGLRS
jgi:hypothetical protein